jgi:hypothetical protein
MMCQIVLASLLASLASMPPRRCDCPDPRDPSQQIGKVQTLESSRKIRSRGARMQECDCREDLRDTRVE